MQAGRAYATCGSLIFLNHVYEYQDPSVYSTVYTLFHVFMYTLLRYTGGVEFLEMDHACKRLDKYRQSYSGEIFIAAVQNATLQPPEGSQLSI